MWELVELSAAGWEVLCALWPAGAVLRGADAHFPAKDPGEIEGVLKPGGGGHGPHRQGAVPQQLCRPLDAVAGQILAGGTAEGGLKGPVEIAAADACLPGDLLHGDGAGVVLLDENGALPGIVLQGVLPPVLSALHQKPQGGLEVARHPHGAGVVAAPGLVNIQQRLAQLLPGGGPQHGAFAGKGRLGQQQPRRGAREAHPIVLPGVLVIRPVVDRRVREGQKRLPRAGDESPAAGLVAPPAGDNVVQQVVVPDTGAPAIARRALLKACIVYGQGQLLPLGGLEAVFEILCQYPHSPLWSKPVSSIHARNRFCN